MGRSEAGRADLEAAVKLDDRHGKAQLALGLMSVEQGHGNAALTHFRRILSTEDQNFTQDEVARFIDGVRTALTLAGKTDETSIYVEQLKSRFPDYPDSFFTVNGE